MSVLKRCRAFVAASGTALVAGSSTAAFAAAASPDAEFLALGSKWRKAYQEYVDTFAPLADAEQRYFRAKVPIPDRATFVGSEGQFAMAQAIAMVENERLDAEAGCPELTRRQHEAGAAVVEIADEIFEIPAKTRKGIRLKVEILRAHKDWESPDIETLLWTDLLNFAGVHDA